MKRLLLASLCALTACSSSTSGSGGGGATCELTGCAVGSHCDVGAGGCVPDGSTCAVTGCLPGYTCDGTSCVADVACDPAACPAGTWCNQYWSACISDPYCAASSDCPPALTCDVGVNRCVDPLATACTDLRDCPIGRLCQTSTSKCVSTITCSTSYPCPRGAECVGGFCARLPAGECNRQVDCFTAGDRCVSGGCVGCATTGAACTGALEACDTATNTCRVCANDGECPAGLVCTADGCAECASDLDCAAYPNRPLCVRRGSEGDAPAAGRCQQCDPRAIPDTCGAGAGCSDYGEYCVPSGLCSTDATCGGTTPYCGAIPGGNQYCGRCANDAQCPAGQGCRMGECHVFPPGDRCQEPIPLALASPRTDLAVSLAGFGWEDPTEWGFYDGYFRFTLTEPTRLVIDGRSAGAWFDGTLRLYSDGCAGLVGRHSIGVLSYNPPYTTYYPAWTVYLPAGTWVLALEGTAKPEYVLSIERTPATLAAGQACWNPIPIVQSPTGSSVTGSTDGLLATSGDVCSADPWDWTARTAVYALDLAAPSYVSLTATPLDPALWLDLDVKDDCRVTEPRTCSAAANEAVTRTFSPMPAGLHYVVVDAERNTNGPYRLDAVVTPWSMNDACADAKPLTFDAGGVANETGTIAVNTSTPSAPSAFCGGLGGNDVFYAFTTTADQRLDVQVQGDGTWKPGVSVRPACGATTGPVCVLATDAGSAAVANVDILPAGTWLVQVASPTGAAGGPFTLQVGLSAPVYPFQENDSCATATVLTAGNTVSGDTRGVTDDVSGACGAEATGAGKDLAYAFSAPSRGAFSATVSVSPTTPGFKPVVRARADCGASTELTCDVASAAGQGAWLPSVYLEGGASVVTWVDGADGTAGAFSLYPIFDPAPANDLCTGATVIGSTWNAISLNVPGSVATAFTDGTCAGAEGPDVFFKMLVPNGRWNVMVTVDPSSYFQPAVAYYGSCGTACAASAVAPAPGANAVLGSVSLNGSGYFGVSSVDGGRGSFNLIVTFQ